MMYLALYLMVATVAYFIMLSSPRGVFVFAPFLAIVGVYRLPESKCVNVFLIPCIGVRFQL